MDMAYSKEVGDVHFTYANGVYMAWEYRNPLSNTWYPIFDSRKLEDATRFLRNYRKVAESSVYDAFAENTGERKSALCGYWRPIEEARVLTS